MSVTEQSQMAVNYSVSRFKKGTVLFHVQSLFGPFYGLYSDQFFFTPMVTVSPLISHSLECPSI